jgi:hypothetical protein
MHLFTDRLAGSPIFYRVASIEAVTNPDITDYALYSIGKMLGFEAPKCIGCKGIKSFERRVALNDSIEYGFECSRIDKGGVVKCPDGFVGIVERGGIQQIQGREIETMILDEFATFDESLFDRTLKSPEAIVANHEYEGVW